MGGLGVGACLSCKRAAMPALPGLAKPKGRDLQRSSAPSGAMRSQQAGGGGMIREHSEEHFTEEVDFEGNSGNEKRRRCILTQNQKKRTTQGSGELSGTTQGSRELSGTTQSHLPPPPHPVCSRGRKAAKGRGLSLSQH